MHPGSGPEFAGPGRSGCSAADASRQIEPAFGAGHRSATSTPSTSGTAASTSTRRWSIATNVNLFLQLLTTQLQNQNPLDPINTNPPLPSIGGQTYTIDKIKRILRSN